MSPNPEGGTGLADNSSSTISFPTNEYSDTNGEVRAGKDFDVGDEDGDVG
jgi:hypothetical protein